MLVDKEIKKMTEDEKLEMLAEIQGVKKAEPVLACGHVDSFEHSLVQGLLQILELGMQAQQDPTDAMMEFVTKAMNTCYINIPSMEEIRKIHLSRHINTEGSIN